MSQLIDLIIQYVRMARYGAADEFESPEGHKEHQTTVIPKIADNKLDDGRAKSQKRASDSTRQQI
jgi:hypothetical protein